MLIMIVVAVIVLFVLTQNGGKETKKMVEEELQVSYTDTPTSFVAALQETLWGQTFIPPQEFDVSYIQMYFENSGPSGNGIYAYITEWDGNSPGTILSSGFISVSELPPTDDIIRINMSPYTLQSGITYALLFEGDGNSLRLKIVNPGSYPDGLLFRWIDPTLTLYQAYDFWFEVWGFTAGGPECEITFGEYVDYSNAWVSCGVDPCSA